MVVTIPNQIQSESPITNYNGVQYKTSSSVSYYLGFRGIITRNLTVMIPQKEGQVNNDLVSTMSSSSDRPQNPLCVDNIKESSLQLILLWSCLAGSFVIMYILHRFHATWFPESIGVLLLGVIVGVFCRYVVPATWGVEVVTQLDPGIFFSFFIPAIIFDAGYTLDRGDFFGNIGGIILYAVVGTVISSIVVACGLYILGQYGVSLELGFVECFMFGALISAVDPVATLAIFCALGVPPTLHYLVFGESIVNDAVAIVLFETFEKFKYATQDDLLQVSFLGLLQFCYVSVGSILVSIVFCVISAFIFKYSALRHTPKLEMGIFFVIAYLSYLVSLPYLSGIMTILTSGILMSHYSLPNLSKQSSVAIMGTSNSLAMICETLTFLYTGFALFAFDNNQWHIPFVCFTILFCLIGRFLNIIPLTGILNLYRTNKIGFKYQFIMWFSGLRGAIAFALAIGLRSDPKGEYIFTATLATVFFTIIFLGGGTYPILKGLKVQKSTEVGAVLPKKDHWLVNLDDKYFQRWFIREDVLAEMRAAEEQALKDYQEKQKEREEEKLAEIVVDNGSKSSIQESESIELMTTHNDSEEK